MKNGEWKMEIWRPTGGELLLLAEAREATGKARR